MKNFPKNVKASETRARSARLAVVVIVLLLCVCCLFFACKKDKAKAYRAEVSEDFKTEYYVGDSFAAVGSLKAYLDEDYFELIPITEDMVTGFDTGEARTVILTVTYGNYVTKVPIRVLALTARTLTVNEDTLPDVVYKDKGFPSGVTMTVTLANGSTEVIPVTAEMLGSFNSSLIGAQTVQISYRGASTLISINVEEDYRKSIELIGAKTEYAVGEMLHTEEVYVKVHYASGEETTTAFTADLVPDFTTAKGKDYTVKVKYKTLTCDYVYSVRKKPKSFELNEASLPTIYEIGDTFPSGGTGVLTYDDDTTETVSLTIANAPAFDTSVAAQNKKVKVVVEGCEDDYVYTVLRAIENMTVYGYTERVRQGDFFDGHGELIVLYEGDEATSERTEYIPLTSEGVKKEKINENGGFLQRITTDRLRIEFRTSEVGDAVTQTVFFRKERKDFTVIVFPKDEDENAVESISLSGVFLPIVCGDEVNVDRMKVTIHYKYKKPESCDCLSDWVSADLPQVVEGNYVEVPVTVRCFGVTAEETRYVKVLSPDYAATVTSLGVQGMQNVFSIGEELSLENVMLVVTYGGGYDSAVLSGAVAEVTDFSTDMAGERKMKVSYGGVTVTLDYRVRSEEEEALVTSLSADDFAPLLFVGDTISQVDRARCGDLIVTYGYKVEKRIAISDESVTLSGGPFTEAGETTITIVYGGDTIVKTVTVYPAADKTKLTAIAVPETVRSEVGAAPNFAAWDLTLIYGYGVSTQTIPLSEAEISDFSVDTEGTKVVTVTYGGQTCTARLYFVAGVSDNVLQGLTISSDSRRVFAVGEGKEALKDVRLIAEYNTKRVTVEVTAAMAKDFSTTEEGKKQISISYGDRAVVFDYTVKTELPQEG